MNNSTVKKLAKNSYPEGTSFRRGIYFDLSLPFVRILHFDPAHNSKGRNYIHVGLQNLLTEGAEKILTYTNRCSNLTGGSVWRDEEVFNLEYEKTSEFLKIESINSEIEARLYFDEYRSRYSNQVRILENCFYIHLYFAEYSKAELLKNDILRVVETNPNPHDWEFKIAKTIKDLFQFISDDRHNLARRLLLEQVLSNRKKIGLNMNI